MQPFLIQEYLLIAAKIYCPLQQLYMHDAQGIFITHYTKYVLL